MLLHNYKLLHYAIHTTKPMSCAADPWLRLCHACSDANNAAAAAVAAAAWN